MRYTQPQSGPLTIDRTHPFGRRNWAAVHVHSASPFGSASPVAILFGTAKNDVGSQGRNLNIVAAGDYLSYGANPALELSTQSGVMIVGLASVTQTTMLYVTSLDTRGGFGVSLLASGKIELSKHDTAILTLSSNVCVVGINVIAWSYNSVTGRGRVAVNGVVTSGSNVQSLSHGTVALGRYWMSDATTNSNPHKQYLFAVSPDECFDDGAMSLVTKSAQNAWQLFKSPQRVMLAAAAGANAASIAWLEQNDTASISASVTASGAASWTEASDTSSIAATVKVSASATWSEPSDANFLAATASVSAVTAWTEAADTTSISAAAQVNCAGAWTEASDVAAITALVGNAVSASAAWAEAPDTAALSGTITVVGSSAWTEASDITAISASTGNSVVGNLTWAEENDIAAITGAAQVSASASWVEPSDTASLGASVAQGDVTRSILEAFALATIMRQSTIAIQGGTMRSTVAAQGGTMEYTLVLSTIMRQSQINTKATMTNASINRTVAFL